MRSEAPDSRDLRPEEIARYSRHLTLPEVGLEGQKRLRASSALLIGAGGLGAPLAMYLAAAGVGRLGLVDFDRVDVSNLQRQVLYAQDDIGELKIERARERIRGINPFVEVELYPVRLEAANAQEILAGYDVIVDGTDNFPTRYLVNDACVLIGKPNVYGSIFRFEGQVSLFGTKDGPCYRCLYPEPPEPGAVPNCAEGGVLGILPGVIGSLQATEVIKYLLGRGESLAGRLLLFDALETRFRELRLRKDPACPVCGDDPTIVELRDESYACEVEPPPAFAEVTPQALRDRLQGDDAPRLLDVRGEVEWAISRIEGATLIPLPELPSRLAELDPEAEIVVYCKMGGRGGRAAALLAERGFRRVSNLVGGIDRWAEEIDPELPRY